MFGWLAGLKFSSPHEEDEQQLKLHKIHYHD
jgi:hypothetical protein